MKEYGQRQSGSIVAATIAVLEKQASSKEKNKSNVKTSSNELSTSSSDSSEDSKSKVKTSSDSQNGDKPVGGYGAPLSRSESFGKRRNSPNISKVVEDSIKRLSGSNKVYKENIPSPRNSAEISKTKSSSSKYDENQNKPLFNKESPSSSFERKREVEKQNLTNLKKDPYPNKNLAEKPAEIEDFYSQSFERDVQQLPEKEIVQRKKSFDERQNSPDSLEEFERESPEKNTNFRRSPQNSTTCEVRRSPPDSTSEHSYCKNIRDLDRPKDLSLERKSPKVEDCRQNRDFSPKERNLPRYGDFEGRPSQSYLRPDLSANKSDQSNRGNTSPRIVEVLPRFPDFGPGSPQNFHQRSDAFSACDRGVYQRNLEEIKFVELENGSSVKKPRSSSKVTVIAAKLKQNATNIKGLLHDTQEVDALCFDLMSNLEEAINNAESCHKNGTFERKVNSKDLSKSTKSGFSYVDVSQYQSNQSDVVLRDKNQSEPVNGDYRNSSSTNDSVFEEEDICNSSDDTDDSDTDSDSSSSSEERVHIVNEGLETITEEDRPVTGCSVRSKEGGDTTSPEEDSTLKDNGWSGTGSAQEESTSDMSTSSSEKNQNGKDSSTRCNEDFQWISKTPSPKMEEQSNTQQQAQNPQNRPPINRHVRDRTPKRQHSDRIAPGSLDRRRHHHHQNRYERDQKSRSSHVPKLSNSKNENDNPHCYNGHNGHNTCQNWCCNPNIDPACYENFNRRHERFDPQRYGSSSMLLEQQRYEYGMGHGSHPDLYSDCRFRHEALSCCAYHAPPPCCRFGDVRNYHWSPPSKPPDDEKVRRLQTEKDSLQLQVAVLNDQIEAQSEKIGELERLLTEKKQLLTNAEDMLQREMLSRSSLETQKLELMSAMSELKLQQAALERENVELRTQFNNNALLGYKKPPLKSRLSPTPQLTSTPVHHLSNQLLSTNISPSTSPLSVSNMSALNHHQRLEVTPVQQEATSPKTPPSTFKRQIDIHYGSLPRQQFVSNGGLTVVDSNANPAANGTRKGVAFGKGISSLLGVRARGHSVPNLAADAEKIVIEDSSEGSMSNNLSPQPSPSLQPNKNRGIKKIFGKMKRSGSGNLEDLPGDGEFKRGGIRATANARLGWSGTETQITPKPDIPFAEWDTETICTWLQELGLDGYVNEAKRYVKNGAHLQSATGHDLEKELGIKNTLHKKKLQLALLDTQENGDPYLSTAGELDTAWVLRWLDDTGLPQHKEAFLMNRIDGRVLHRLTMDDLAVLHINSVLQVASLKRGIQVLREHNFDPSCLQRRSLPDDPAEPTAQQVACWTSHRVMEWLRAVDLAEYAPNLRGAGVHGGLMVLEPRFTAELLATLLSIPPGKTLLRRHLNTHFKELLGRDCIQEKREAESTLGYVPITPAAKIKVTKKSQFSLKKKKDKGETDYGDLVCPLNPSNQSDEEERKSKGRGCLSANR